MARKMTASTWFSLSVFGSQTYGFCHTLFPVTVNSCDSRIQVHHALLLSERFPYDLFSFLLGWYRFYAFAVVCIWCETLDIFDRGMLVGDTNLGNSFLVGENKYLVRGAVYIL